VEVTVSVVSVVKCAEVSVEFSGKVCGIQCHAVDRNKCCILVTDTELINISA